MLGGRGVGGKALGNGIGELSDQGCRLAGEKGEGLGSVETKAWGG